MGNTNDVSSNASSTPSISGTSSSSVSSQNLEWSTSLVDISPSAVSSLSKSSFKNSQLASPSQHEHDYYSAIERASFFNDSASTIGNITSRRECEMESPFPLKDASLDLSTISLQSILPSLSLQEKAKSISQLVNTESSEVYNKATHPSFDMEYPESLHSGRYRCAAEGDNKPNQEQPKKAEGSFAEFPSSHQMDVDRAKYQLTQPSRMPLCGRGYERIRNVHKLTTLSQEPELGHLKIKSDSIPPRSNVEPTIGVGDVQSTRSLSPTVFLQHTTGQETTATAYHSTAISDAESHHGHIRPKARSNSSASSVSSRLVKVASRFDHKNDCITPLTLSMLTPHLTRTAVTRSTVPSEPPMSTNENNAGAYRTVETSTNPRRQGSNISPADQPVARISLVREPRECNIFRRRLGYPLHTAPYEEHWHLEKHIAPQAQMQLERESAGGIAPHEDARMNIEESRLVVSSKLQQVDDWCRTYGSGKNPTTMIFNDLVVECNERNLVAKGLTEPLLAREPRDMMLQDQFTFVTGPTKRYNRIIIFSLCVLGWMGGAGIQQMLYCQYDEIGNSHHDQTPNAISTLNNNNPFLFVQVTQLIASAIGVSMVFLIMLIVSSGKSIAIQGINKTLFLPRNRSRLHNIPPSSSGIISYGEEPISSEHFENRITLETGKFDSHSPFLVDRRLQSLTVVPYTEDKLEQGMMYGTPDGSMKKAANSLSTSHHNSLLVELSSDNHKSRNNKYLCEQIRTKFRATFLTREFSRTIFSVLLVSLSRWCWVEATPVSLTNINTVILSYYIGMFSVGVLCLILNFKKKNSSWSWSMPFLSIMIIGSSFWILEILLVAPRHRVNLQGWALGPFGMPAIDRNWVPIRHTDCWKSTIKSIFFSGGSGLAYGIFLVLSRCLLDNVVKKIQHSYYRIVTTTLLAHYTSSIIVGMSMIGLAVLFNKIPLLTLDKANGGNSDSLQTSLVLRDIRPNLYFFLEGVQSVELALNWGITIILLGCSKTPFFVMMAQLLYIPAGMLISATYKHDGFDVYECILGIIIVVSIAFMGFSGKQFAEIPMHSR